MSVQSDTSPALEQLKFLSPAEVRHVAETFGTPAFVYDEERIRAGVAQLQQLPSAYGHTIRYSLKASPSAAVIRIFDSMGVEFDASSVWEVIRAVRAGVAPEKILMTAQEADFGSTELPELIRQGLKFDAGSLQQLAEYGQAFPGTEVSVRINPGFGSGLVRRLTSGGPDSSFGIWHEQVAEVKALVERYSLTVVRLHVHIGSGHHADVLLPAARRLLEIAKDFADVHVVDLGGGYRLTVMADDPEYDHSEWAEELASDLRLFQEETGRELHMEMEPGTFLVANAGAIVAKVIDVVSTGDEGRRFVKINAGLTEILRPSYYGSPHPVVAVTRKGELPPEGPLTCVAGHCCIAGDMLTTRPGSVEELSPVRLGEVTPGDYLVIERSGGYCASMSMKNFNSYPEAPEVLRRTDGTFTLIRSRQTIDQLTANELIPDDLRKASA
ncbi:diaminopimelate decarboxylase [Streptomyces sp. NPDC057555]|uniref:diaminopimelate decarboxylase n=1 Tax=Streptomyces sp. NPDC057555 TaxID=3346166 RepID=UPI0036BD436E